MQRPGGGAANEGGGVGAVGGKAFVSFGAHVWDVVRGRGALARVERAWGHNYHQAYSSIQSIRHHGAPTGSCIHSIQSIHGFRSHHAAEFMIRYFN